MAYDSVSVQEVEEALTKAKLPHSIVIDCSHCNRSIKGVMIESNLEDGQQKLVMGKKELLKRGVSITEQSLLQAYEQLQLAK